MTNADVRRTGADLRSLTAARVSLPMSGHSVATAGVLEFQLAHARARDAVHTPFHAEEFARELRDQLPMLAKHGVEILTLETMAKDRVSYLRYPERGRALDPASAAMLKTSPCDLAITIADGLSALAVKRNAIQLLVALLPQLAQEAWMLGTLTVVQQGRVAVSDAIGEGLGAKCSLLLCGERPGLSAADSMGAYLTWNPRVGRTDAERNCVSNIRSGGLPAEEAATRLMWLMNSARAMRSTGVMLKEGTANSLPGI